MISRSTAEGQKVNSRNVDEFSRSTGSDQGDQVQRQHQFGGGEGTLNLERSEPQSSSV